MNNSGVLNNNKEQKLFLTTISKFGFFLLFVLFAFAVVVSLYITLRAPKPWQSTILSTWRCAGVENTYSYNCKGVDMLDKTNKITVQLGPYTIFNQETRLEYYFNRISTKKLSSFTGDVSIKYTIYGTNMLSQYGQRIEKSKMTELESKTIKSQVVCKARKDTCEPNYIATEIYLDYPIYVVELQVISESVKTEVADMILKTTNVQSSYTVFELLWRLVFILFSCVCTIVYLFANRSIPQDKWSHEQKWTVVLLTFLIWENNPLYPYEFLKDNAFYLFVNSIIDTVFICFLMFYVLIMFDALRKPIKQRTTFRFYFPRALLCIVLFGLVLASFMYNKTRKIYSPTVTGSHDVWNVVISLSILVLLVIYLFWLFFSIIRSFSEIRKLGQTGYRVQVYGLFTLFILALYVALLLTAFFMGYRNNAAVSLTTIAYVNFYCMVLTILYLPAAAVDELKKQNITVAKLDEEKLDIVVEDYGDADAHKEEEIIIED